MLVARNSCSFPALVGTRREPGTGRPGSEGMERLPRAVRLPRWCVRSSERAVWTAAPEAVDVLGTLMLRGGTCTVGETVLMLMQ